MISSGDVIRNKYKIIKQLGQGGMAQVWLAEEIKMGNRQVAIKAPLPGISEQENQILRARFQREIKVSAELVKAETPNVVKALTVEPYEDGDLLVMEYMSGGDLAQKIAEHPNGMPIDEILNISTDILTALDAIHNHPLTITHRDIKPSNILFNSKDQTCLGDFGLAQMARVSGTLSQTISDSTLIFTPAYCAPELVNPSEFVTPAADIYSFGCVLWEMMTGRLYKSSKPNTPASHFNSNIPEWVDEAIKKCLLIDPWERWENPKDVKLLFQEKVGQISTNSKIVLSENVSISSSDSNNPEVSTIPNIVINQKLSDYSDEQKGKKYYYLDPRSEIELNPAYANIYDEKILTIEQLIGEGSLNVILDDHNRVVKLNPTYGIGFAQRGETFRLMGKLDEAIADFTKAIELKAENDWPYLARAKAFNMKGEFHNALKDINYLININSYNLEALATRGETYRLMGRLNEAISDLNIATEKKWYPWAIGTRGQIRKLMGMYKQAISDFNEVIELQPTAWTYCQRGESYRFIKEYEKSISDFTQSLLNNINYMRPYIQRGETYIEIGRYDAAIADFTNALDLDNSLSFVKDELDKITNRNNRK